jgi:hypothetical protein
MYYCCISYLPEIPITNVIGWCDDIVDVYYFIVIFSLNSLKSNHSSRIMLTTAQEVNVDLLTANVDNEHVQWLNKEMQKHETVWLVFYRYVDDNPHMYNVSNASSIEDNGEVFVETISYSMH